jgi:hypothetical protein
VKTAKKALLGGVAAAVMVMGLPMTSASADPGDTIHGGCSFNTDANQTATQGQNTGVIEATAISLTSANTPDAGASVHCKIQVNGSDALGTQLDVHANAAGIEQGQQQITFDDQGGTLPSALCEKDDWGDGDTTGWVCQASTEITLPPQVVIDLINTVFDTINGVLALVDLNPVLCPLLQAVGPQNIGGVIVIDADGSLTISDPLGVIIVTNDCTP